MSTNLRQAYVVGSGALIDVTSSVTLADTFIRGIFASGIGGCTVTVMNSNAQYYATMKQCIDVGATFVPGKGQGEAACVSH